MKRSKKEMSRKVIHIKRVYMINKSSASKHELEYKIIIIRILHTHILN